MIKQTINGVSISFDGDKLVIEGVGKGSSSSKNVTIDSNGVIKGDVNGNITINNSGIILMIEGDVTGNIVGAADVQVQGDVTGNINCKRFSKGD